MATLLRKLIVALFVGVITLPALAEHHGDADPDKAAIKAAVFDYFHGQGEASLERLQRGFAADIVSMAGAVQNDDGETELRVWKDMNEVLARWASNDNPPGGDRDGEILHMEILDGRLAVVLFRYEDRFYDALTLAKVDDQWKITGKTFILQ